MDPEKKRKAQNFKKGLLLKKTPTKRVVKPGHHRQDDPLTRLLSNPNRARLRINKTTVLKCDFKSLGSQFVPDHVIGKGQFGCVYETTVNTDQGGFFRFATKLVADNASEGRRDVMFRDWDIGQRISHPNIMSVYGYDYGDGKLLIYLELLRTDWDIIYKKAQDVGEIIPEFVLRHVAAGFGNAIKYLSDQKILHRDIKPNNTLLGFDGSIKLGDFGISRQNFDQGQLTVVGAEPYMSPERIMQKEYDVKSDLWSCGMTLLELATFSNPIRGEKKHIGFDDTHRIVTGNFSKDVNLDVYSQDLQDFIINCLKTTLSERCSIEEYQGHQWLLESNSICPEEISTWYNAIEEMDTRIKGDLIEIGSLELNSREVSSEALDDDFDREVTVIPHDGEE
eukprot:m.110508 g.110508  ORF g.110508 m.110508 type:complete len:394 (+) comp9222_c0_seq2:109-1290(+)